MRLMIVGVLTLLCLFAALCFMKNGEVLEVMTGDVQKCEILGGSAVAQLAHATIKSENGVYVISSLRDCNPGAEVNILIKRGALFFNTIYAAENACDPQAPAHCASAQEVPEATEATGSEPLAPPLIAWRSTCPLNHFLSLGFDALCQRSSC